MIRLKNVTVVYAATAYVAAALAYGFFAGSWSPTTTDARAAAKALKELDRGCFASEKSAIDPIPTHCKPESTLLSTEVALEHLRELALSRRGSWQAYFAVVIAALGFVAARPTALATTPMTLLISIVFGVFAFANLGALTKLQSESIRLAEYLCSTTYCELESTALLHKLVRSMRPYSPYQVWGFHLVSDWVTLVLFWNLPTRGDPGHSA